MSRYGNYDNSIFNLVCEKLNKIKIMDTKEIEKMLKDKELSPELKKALEDRKKILDNDKYVKK